MKRMRSRDSTARISGTGPRSCPPTLTRCLLHCPDPMPCCAGVRAPRTVSFNQPIHGEFPMSVYFVYRSHYEGPSAKHVKRFDDATVLDWFRNHWQPIADEDAAYAHARRLLGCDVYSFGRLFVRIAENGTPAPQTAHELETYLPDYLYVNMMTCSRHALQIHTDDDELEMAIYFFDDQFLESHGK